MPLKLRRMRVPQLLVAFALTMAWSTTPAAGGESQPRITWSEGEIAITLPPGGAASANLTLASSQNLQNITLQAVPQLAPFVTLQPNTFTSVMAQQPQSVQLSFFIPVGTGEGTYEGTIHVRSGKRTLPQVLKVSIQVKKSASSVTGVVPPEGGSVELPGAGSITFPAGAFATSQTVRVETTNSPETEQDFQESASIFRFSQRLSYELRINTGNSGPLTDFGVKLNVPDSFLNSLPPNSDIRLFAQLWEDGGEELLDNFELVDSSFDSAAKTVEATLPKDAFTNKRRPDGTFEAIFILAATPGPVTPLASLAGDTSAPTLQAAAAGGCEGASLGSPLEGNLDVNRHFNRAGETHPVTGQKAAHYGTDLGAANGDNVLAVADGVVEKVDFQFNQAKGTGWGQYVVLRHGDGSASLYAHLQTGSPIAQGTTVTRGQMIAQADSSGGVTGPHLHLEYAPNGQIFERAGKVDPFPCIGNNVRTSITVGDNGTAADDAFQVFLDNLSLGQTTIGGTNTLAAGNLRPGTHTLRIVAVIAPDNVGTLGVSLADGVTFSDGTTTRSEVLPQGGQVTYTIIVPNQPSSPFTQSAPARLEPQQGEP